MILDDLFGLTGKSRWSRGRRARSAGRWRTGWQRRARKSASLGRRAEKAEALVGGDPQRQVARQWPCPPTYSTKTRSSRHATQVLDQWGGVDILVNAAGGNVPAATLGPDRTIFDLSREAFAQVFDLNLMGSLLPTQVFGAAMAGQLPGQEGEGHDRGGHGTIVMISSMAAQRAAHPRRWLRAAKAAIDNFTRWMATELARTYGGGLRVNAIAPGFLHRRAKSRPAHRARWQPDRAWRVHHRPHPGRPLR